MLYQWRIQPDIQLCTFRYKPSQCLNKTRFVDLKWLSHCHTSRLLLQSPETVEVFVGISWNCRKYWENCQNTLVLHFRAQNLPVSGSRSTDSCMRNFNKKGLVDLNVLFLVTRIICFSFFPYAMKSHLFLSWQGKTLWVSAKWTSVEPHHCCCRLKQKNNFVKVIMNFTICINGLHKTRLDWIRKSELNVFDYWF